MKPLNNYLLLEKVTPVIEQLFKYQNLSHYFQSIYTFEDKKIKWSLVVKQLKPIIKRFDLKFPLTAMNDPLDFFDKLLMQMVNCPSFKKEHINCMHEVIYALLDTQAITISILFKLALIFDDGSGLSKLVMRKHNLVLTRRASIQLDKQSLQTFMDGYSDQLAKKYLDNAARTLCYFILHTLCNLYAPNEKEQLIKLIQKKIYFIYQKIEEERANTDPF